MIRLSVVAALAVLCSCGEMGSTDGGASGGGAATGGSGGAGGSAGGTAGGSTGGGTAGSNGGGSAGSGGGSAGGSAGGAVDAGRCPLARLCDDFEAYDAGLAPPLPRWKTSENAGTVRVDRTRAFSGQQSVHLTITQPGTYHRAYFSNEGSPVFPLPGNVMWGRMMMYATSVPSPSVHWTNIQGEGLAVDAGIGDGGTATFRALTRYGGQQMKKIMTNYETTNTPVQSDCYQHSTQVFPEGRWACFEWELNGPANTMNLFLDGVAVPNMLVHGAGQGCVHPQLGNKWTIPTYDAIRLGWEHYQQSSTAHEFWIDDVAIDTQRIGCP